MSVSVLFGQAGSNRAIRMFDCDHDSFTYGAIMTKDCPLCLHQFVVNPAIMTHANKNSLCLGLGP